MRPEKLNYILSSISSLKGVGPKLEQIINKLGIYKNIHFVWNIPNNILERKFYENIHDAEINSLVTLNLKIIKHEPSRFKRQPYKIKCICGDTNIDLVYFNARHPMLRQMLPTNENRLISGKLEYFRNTFQITHPSHVSALNNNKIIKSKEAVYSLTSGLNQNIMNKLTDQILNNLPNFNEWIETSILNKYKFKGWNEVVKNLHNPSDNNIKNKNLLRRRLAFDELLSHQLAIGIMRNFNQKKKGLKIISENKTLNKFYSNLDFQLTNSQNNVIKEILQDLGSSNQMIRLLQGDVGSGKTIVALISMIKVFESNFQSALMVPTTILYQRMVFNHKNHKPNILVMSATPIPRTLTLAAYGDMKESKLIEKPLGRKPIITSSLSLKKENQLIDRIKEKIKNSSSKFYWVCPLIEESEELDLKAAEERYKILKKYFKNKVLLMHGRLSEIEKEEIMTKFKNEDYKILVSTTVIEVGVDIPSATTIVIEHAERFGLAQLHQLRGRVGRNDIQSYCILLHKDNIGEISKQRIDIMKQTNDGFKIAEEDLKIRGPGEILGKKQSGSPSFYVADLSFDYDLLEDAKIMVEDILSKNPKLENIEGENLRNLLYLQERDAAILTLTAG